MSSQPLMFFLAFLAVLALIGAAAWLVRRFAGNRLGTNASRGRMPRLAVIDAAAVDGRRRLVLVRRDNVEHLLMIGGPSDIVIEPNIVRATPARDPLPTRGGVEPRMTPSDLGQWEAEVAAEPAEPELPPMPPRPAPRPAPPAMPERRPSDPFAGLVPEPLARPEPPLPPLQRAEPPILRAEPPVMRSEPPVMRAEPPVMRAEPPIMRADPPILRPEPPRPEPRPEPRMEPAPRPRAEPAMPRPPRPEPKPAPAPRAERPAPPPPPPPPPPAPSAAPVATAAPAAAAPAVAALSTADQNLAEMANRLEAALRRPPTAPPQSPRRRSLPNRRGRPHRPRALPNRPKKRRPRPNRLPARPVSKASKTRWRPCSADRSRLRERLDHPA
uniref:Flagellar biosynthesis protein FliO n=1 Tax=Rhodopseudomonas palustris (strain DX-1) TaxID=652103 RepID=E6VHJ2_RHOPX